LGVLKGSTQEKYAKGELAGAGVEIIAYEAQDQVYLDIKAGRLDGTVADVVEVKGGFLDTPDGKDYVFVGKPLGKFVNYFGDGAGIAVRKQDTDLRTMLDKGITSLRTNGTWQTINDKYFAGTSVWGD